MSRAFRAYLKTGITAPLIAAVFLFFSLCCCVPTGMAAAHNSASSMSMSSEMASPNAPLNHNTKTTFCLINADDCKSCQCKKATAALKDDNSKKFHLIAMTLTSGCSKLATAILGQTVNSELRLAFRYRSPPQILQESIPVYLLDRDLRL